MRGLTALFVALAGACTFAADYGQTSFRCDESDGCPAGFRCDLDRCVPDGSEGDGGPSGEFLYRKRLTIPVGRVDASIDDYTLLVAPGPDPELAAHVRPDGQDVAFHLGDHPLPHEIESWDAASGTLVAWVRVPRMEADEATELWLLYGAGPGAREQVAETWEGFVGVWHLDGSAIEDSLGGVDGVVVGDGGIDDGQIGAGHRLDGGFVTLGDEEEDHLELVDDQAGTLSVWLLVEQDTETWQLLGGKGGTSPVTPGYSMEVSTDNTDLYACVSDAVDYVCTERVPTPSRDVWHHLAMVVDRDEQHIRFHIDGELVATSDDITGMDPSADDANDHPFNLGANCNENLRWPGLVDELRFSRRETPSAVLRADFASQSAPAEFIEVGPEESAP